MHLLACWSFLAAVTADSGCIGYVEKPANVQLKFKLKGQKFSHSDLEFPRDYYFLGCSDLDISLEIMST